MTSGTNYRWVTALIAALGVGLVAAIVTPRYGDSDGVDWLVTIGLAVLTGAIVAFATREKTDDGAHVKDDVLP
jgi:hypothetical protein